MKSWIAWWGVELSVVSTREKIVSALGGLISIALLVGISLRVLHAPVATGVVASMGASAVLLFAVPHGQLSQPWPVLAGHCLPAGIGVACARWIGPPEWAAATAVGLSIVVMHQFRCIHPPGGATALTAVLGSSAIHDLGFGFVLDPVMANALAMIALAVGFNFCFGWRRYPAAWNRRALAAVRPEPEAPSHEKVVAALRSLDSFVDITEEDLVRLCRILQPAQSPGAIEERDRFPGPVAGPAEVFPGNFPTRGEESRRRE